MTELRMHEHDVCDFCSDPKPVRQFSAPDFVMDKSAPQLVSRGAWMACKECGELVDARDWKGLEARAVRQLTPHYASLIVLRDIIRTSHTLFKKHMRLDA